MANNNLFSVPIEQIVEKGAFFAADQKTFLFQLSLYAAMWHLKHNVKAFAPEELAKYPEWFRKKVEGFEVNILERLKKWTLSNELGDPDAPTFYYNVSKRKVTTPLFSPFPPVLDPLMIIHWHELFHACRSQKIAAEPEWLGERDAMLVAAIITFKINRVDFERDETFEKIIANFVRPFVANNPLIRNKEEMLVSNTRYFQIMHSYALAFYEHQEEKIKKGEPAMEEAILQTYFELRMIRGRFQFPSWPSNIDLETIRREVSLHKKEAEDSIHQWEKRVYLWPPDSQQATSVSFIGLLQALNYFCEARKDGLTQEDFLKISPYLLEVYKYWQLLSRVDGWKFQLEHLNSGLRPEHWPPFKFDTNLVLTFRFYQKHRSLFLITYFSLPERP